MFIKNIFVSVSIAIVALNSADYAQAQDAQLLNSNAQVIQTEEQAKALAASMSEEQKQELKQTVMNEVQKGNNCKDIYKKFVLAPSMGISIIPLFIPISFAYMIIGLPLSIPDHLMGCENIYDI